ncbi:MAG: hypothetical protein Q7S08_01760, partial [bacterium]|nr:hypothetical protein [bacterium]
RRFRVYFVHTREFSPDLAVKPEKWACFRIAANQILLLYPHMYNYGICSRIRRLDLLPWVDGEEETETGPNFWS